MKKTIDHMLDYRLMTIGDYEAAYDLWIKCGNAFESIRSIDIPIWFFAGEHDMTCATSVQKEYYETIEAPQKEFFLYEGCAHSPIYEDGAMTREILNKILEK